MNHGILGDPIFIISRDNGQSCLATLSPWFNINQNDRNKHVEGSKSVGLLLVMVHFGHYVSGLTMVQYTSHLLIMLISSVLRCHLRPYICKAPASFGCCGRLFCPILLYIDIANPSKLRAQQNYAKVGFKSTEPCAKDCLLTNPAGCWIAPLPWKHMNFLHGDYNDSNKIVDERRASLWSNRNSLKIGHPQFEGLITLLSECIVKGSHLSLGSGGGPLFAWRYFTVRNRLRLFATVHDLLSIVMPCCAYGGNLKVKISTILHVLQVDTLVWLKGEGSSVANGFAALTQTFCAAFGRWDCFSWQAQYLGEVQGHFSWQVMLYTWNVRAARSSVEVQIVRQAQYIARESFLVPHSTLHVTSSEHLLSTLHLFRKF